MGRISREEMLMGVAQVIAQRGTCSRLQVGAVFSRDGRIISTGYNGVPSGLPHCNHDCNCPAADWNNTDHLSDCPAVAPCEDAEHAERNGIAFAARHGLALEGSELHCTHAPCAPCARSIINAGITKVTFETPYRLTQGVELLVAAGLTVVAPA